MFISWVLFEMTIAFSFPQETGWSCMNGLNAVVGGAWKDH
jgi:hypothetical protein